jgi:hypothetical protein
MAGCDAGRLPIAVQLIGRRWADQRLLAAARVLARRSQLQRCTRWSRSHHPARAGARCHGDRYPLRVGKPGPDTQHHPARLDHRTAQRPDTGGGCAIDDDIRDLRPESQTDEQFNAQLESSIEQIYQASVHKQPTSP